MIGDLDLKQDQNYNSSSMNFSEISDRKSVNSLDCLFSRHESKKVYSEKCLLNKRDFFMFKGRNSRPQNNTFFLGKRGKFKEDSQKYNGKDRSLKDKKRLNISPFLILDGTKLKIKSCKSMDKRILNLKQ